MKKMDFDLSNAKSVEEAEEMVRDQMVYDMHLNVVDSEEQIEKFFYDIYEKDNLCVYHRECFNKCYQLDGYTDGGLSKDGVVIAREELWVEVSVCEHYVDSGSDDYVYTISVV